jgi:hypothetical protein
VTLADKLHDASLWAVVIVILLAVLFSSEVSPHLGEQSVGDGHLRQQLPPA